MLFRSGISAKSLVSSSKWLTAPEFLWQVEGQWPAIPCQLPLLPDEFIVLRQQTYSVHRRDLNRTTLADRFSRVSSWCRLKKAIAWILRLKAILQLSSTLSADEIKAAEVEIIKCVQSSAFHSELATLRKETSGSAPKRCSAFRRLNPVLFEGVLRVGGRLSKAPIEFAVKHPVILPSSHHVTRLIIEEHHKAVGHSGMSHTWLSLRQRYWILKGAATVCKILGSCILCKRRYFHLVVRSCLNCLPNAYPMVILLFALQG